MSKRFCFVLYLMYKNPVSEHQRFTVISVIENCATSFVLMPTWPGGTPVPLLHLLLHVDALLLQKFSLGKSPVHRLHGRLS